jgi:hypothetical protein
MRNIQHDLNNIVTALKQNKSVICKHNGEWSVESAIMGWARDLFGLQKGRILSIAHALIKELDRAERTPILFSQNKGLVAQTFNYQGLIEASQIVLEKLEPFTAPNDLEWSNRLARRLVALQYRLESSNGGLDPTVPQLDLIHDLEFAALAWKKNHSLLVDKSLNHQELELLRETTQYPEFAELVLKDAALQNAYFFWIIREHNPVSPFVEFPVILEEIVDCSLSGRISRMGGKDLKITKSAGNDGLLEKIITLPFEKKPVSLLNEKTKITFRGNYQLTIREIFHIFKSKKYKVGNLEYLADGFINWNAHHLGWWNADRRAFVRIDLSKPHWWEQLPSFETLERDEVEEKYGIRLTDNDWIAAAMATRGTPTLNFDGTHAFMELVIPRQDKRYAVLDFGKFAWEFPASIFESLIKFCLNLHATIAFPDENIFYTHRQHGHLSYRMTAEQGLHMMDMIKADMLKSRENNLVFQIESDNCARWLYEKLTVIFGKEKLPNLFRMPLMKTQPVGFVRKLFDFLGLFPEHLQFRMLAAIHIPFGAGKETWIYENGERVKKCLMSHEFWTSSEVYLPAFLIEQLHKGALAKSCSFTEDSPVSAFTPAQEAHIPSMTNSSIILPKTFSNIAGFDALRKLTRRRIDYNKSASQAKIFS